MPEGDRKLSEEDVKAIVDQLKEQLVSDFYGEVGRGLWAWVKRAIMVMLFLLALQGIVGDRAFMQSLIEHR